MSRSRMTLVFLSLLVGVSAFAQDIPLHNWSAPQTWTPPTASASHHLTPVANANELTLGPLPFFPITPCRVADTRGNGFTGAYGTPSLVASSVRNFTITGQCGIPASAAAVSFNFTVANTASSGDLRFYPAGGTVPTVSTINWLASTIVIANAAIVPLSTSGAIAAQNDATTTVDLIIDVNGYYFDDNRGAMSTGQFFGIMGDYQGGGVLFGRNNEPTAANSIGVRGFAYSTGAGSAGVSGEQFGATGVNYGVKGLNGSTTALSAGVFGQNTNATTGNTYGVVGAVTTGGTQAAGVRGYVGTGIQNDGWSHAGVRGESDNFGILGVSTSLGAGGFLHNGTGALLSGSYLGFSSTDGLHTIGNTSATGTKNFVEPHPTDPSLVIKYATLEGNEVGTYFRGRGHFVGGAAVIMVPADFKMVTEADGMSIQVTPIGDFTNVAVVSIDLDKVVLKATNDTEFFYTVNGIRHGYRDYQPIQPGNEYVPMSAAQKMPGAYGPEIRKRLIDNGTFNSDGSPNMETARRLGWTKEWAERDNER